MDDCFGDELLERIGNDRHLAAAAEAGAARADVAARPIGTRPGVELHLAVAAAQKAGEEVPAGAPVRAPIRVTEPCADPVRLLRSDDRRPVRLRDDLA